MDEGCEKFLEKKRQFQKEEEKVKRKFIPANIRKLLRRKSKLSKRILSSNDWIKNHKIMEEIEEIEENLKQSYMKRKYEFERKAICKISENSSEFFKYANKYKNCSEGIGVLQNGSEYVNDDSVKSELLQSQFCSVWSNPSVYHEIQDLECIFGQCLNCINEETHICKYDIISEVI